MNASPWQSVMGHLGKDKGGTSSSEKSNQRHDFMVLGINFNGDEWTRQLKLYMTEGHRMSISNPCMGILMGCQTAVAAVNIANQVSMDDYQ